MSVLPNIVNSQVKTFFRLIDCWQKISEGYTRRYETRCQFSLPPPRYPGTRVDTKVSTYFNDVTLSGIVSFFIQAELTQGCD